MEMNSTMLEKDSFFHPSMHLLNFVLSSAGVLINVVLLLVMFLIGRRRCASYFLLILMSICDLLYSLVYTSIWLTSHSFLNLVNHQILCPLSFFLTPFSFTGSTLLLLVCLIHWLKDFHRQYETVLGQISGRLSVVFIFAFLIVRSVLGSTSIELMSDSVRPNVRHCTIDMNTPLIVAKIEHINHIFAELTDILVYLSWFVLLLLRILSNLRSPKKSFEMRRTNTSSMDQRLKHQQRHADVSLIIVSLTILSLIFYLPVMSSKFFSLELTLRGETLFTGELIPFLQEIQQASHLFCLSIRFVPYLLFDQRVRAFLHRMIGWKIQRTSPVVSRQFLCRCRCSTERQRTRL